jgi:predicted short-subunit dehydrogenase-like oxidoreductase (DUF2520 family)
MAKPDVAIIGLGNFGSSLLAALRHAAIPVREVISRNRRSSTTTLAKSKLDADIVWLCVPDDAIAQITEKIVEQRLRKGKPLRGQLVVHSSGALTVDVLDAARKAGAAVASVHPVMSFPTRKVVALQGVLFGVEAEPPQVKRRLYALIRGLGGQPFAIESAKKALYHAAGTLASPLLVSELTAAMATAKLAGLSAEEARKWVRALAQATMQNLFERGAARSFSGPFARGDVATIRLHLQALTEHPMVTGIYGSLARYAVETLPVERKSELQSLFRNPGMRH